MPISTASVTVATTATLIASGREARDMVTVVLKGASGDMYLGGSDVTTSSGVLLSSTDTFSIDLGPADSLYAIVASGTQTVRKLVTRQ